MFPHPDGPGNSPIRKDQVDKVYNGFLQRFPDNPFFIHWNEERLIWLSDRVCRGSHVREVVAYIGDNIEFFEKRKIRVNTGVHGDPLGNMRTDMGKEEELVNFINYT